MRGSSELSAGGRVYADPGFPLIELVRCAAREGCRERLAGLFEHELADGYEAAGIRLIGSFVEADRPDSFIFIRGFRSMHARRRDLAAFHDGPVWAAHREAVADMVESQQISLFHAPTPAAEFDLAGSTLEETPPAGVVVAVIHRLHAHVGEALRVFEFEVKPRLQDAGMLPLAWLVSEPEVHSYLELPAAADPNALLWFCRFDDEPDYYARQGMLRCVTAAMSAFAKYPEKVLLRPTSRSPLLGLGRGAAGE